jgi:hypothetical protein
MGVQARSGRSPLPIHVAPPTAPDGEAQHAALLEMVERIGRIAPTSGSEALQALRVAFPDSPLTLRVAALNMLMRQQESGYRPR